MYTKGRQLFSKPLSHGLSQKRTVKVVLVHVESKSDLQFVLCTMIRCLWAVLPKLCQSADISVLNNGGSKILNNFCPHYPILPGLTRFLV